MKWSDLTFKQRNQAWKESGLSYFDAKALFEQLPEYLGGKEAQQTVRYGTPEYADAYRSHRIVNSYDEKDDAYSYTLPEVAVTPSKNLDLATSVANRQSLFAKDYMATPLEYAPIIGDAIDAGRVVKDASLGNYTAAALGAGMFLLPNIAEKPLKAIARSLHLPQAAKKFSNIRDSFNRAVLREYDGKLSQIFPITLTQKQEATNRVRRIVNTSVNDYNDYIDALIKYGRLTEFKPNSARVDLFGIQKEIDFFIKLPHSLNLRIFKNDIPSSASLPEPLKIKSQDDVKLKSGRDLGYVSSVDTDNFNFNIRFGKIPGSNAIGQYSVANNKPKITMVTKHHMLRSQSNSELRSTINHELGHHLSNTSRINPKAAYEKSLDEVLSVYDEPSKYYTLNENSKLGLFLKPHMAEEKGWLSSPSELYSEYFSDRLGNFLILRGKGKSVKEAIEKEDTLERFHKYLFDPRSRVARRGFFKNDLSEDKKKEISSYLYKIFPSVTGLGLIQKHRSKEEKEGSTKNNSHGLE